MEPQSLKKGRFLIQEVIEPKRTIIKPLCRHESINPKKHFYYSERDATFQRNVSDILSYVYDFKSNTWIDLSKEKLFESRDSEFKFIDFSSESDVNNTSIESLSKQKTNDDSMIKLRRPTRNINKYRSGTNLSEFFIKLEGEKMLTTPSKKNNRFSSNNICFQKHLSLKMNNKKNYKICSVNNIKFRAENNRKNFFMNLQINPELSFQL